MKKLLLLVAIASISLGSFAQKQFGLKVGLNLAKISTVYNTDDDAKDYLDKAEDYRAYTSGLNIGVAFNTGGENFSFQPELAYSQRGYDILDMDKKAAGYARYNYIDIKPLFNWGGGNDVWKAYAQFGPSINFWLSKKTYDKDGDIIDKSDEWAEDNDEDGAGRLDIRGELGFVLGAGFKYKVGPGWALVNPRYEWGLSPMTIVDTGSKGYAIVNRTFSINVGYLYEF